jgi:hypothetical protein
VNLQQLRDYIRAQLDVEEDELPNDMADAYLAEAYIRTMSMENRWPFFETSWTITKVGTDAAVELPPDVDPAGLFAVRANGARLVQVSNEQAEDSTAQMAGTSTPGWYTIWGRELRLWPSPNVDTTLTLRGYRLPSDWISNGAGAEVDADVRLHRLLAHYAIALAYAQQEDEVLEDTYMKRWQASFMAARNAICNPRHNRPLVFSGGMAIIGVGAAPGATWASPPVEP